MDISLMSKKVAALVIDLTSLSQIHKIMISPQSNLQFNTYRVENTGKSKSIIIFNYNQLSIINKHNNLKSFFYLYTEYGSMQEKSMLTNIQTFLT